jgi:hypothetical protein
MGIVVLPVIQKYQYENRGRSVPFADAGQTEYTHPAVCTGAVGPELRYPGEQETVSQAPEGEVSGWETFVGIYAVLEAVEGFRHEERLGSYLLQVLCPGAFRQGLPGRSGALGQVLARLKAVSNIAGVEEIGAGQRQMQLALEMPDAARSDLAG